MTMAGFNVLSATSSLFTTPQWNVTLSLSIFKPLAIHVTYATNSVRLGTLWNATSTGFIQRLVRFDRNCSPVLDVESEILLRMVKHDDGRFQCVECNFFSLHNSTMKCHIESKHLQTSGYTCQICKKFCPTRNALKSHKSRIHKNTSDGGFLF